MSYSIEKRKGSFCVVNDEDNSVYQEYDTRREAVKELKVLMAVPEKKESGEKKKKGDNGQKIADEEEGEY